MRKRESFLIVAKPGAAGKTTIMGAMLSLRPEEEELVVYSNDTAHKIEKITGQKCFVVHEIGSGSWYGYVGNKSAINFLEIPQKNPNLAIAGNLHCDTIDDIKSLISSFGASQSLLNNVQLLIFLEFNPKKNPSRKIKEIWHLEHEQHTRIFSF